ncbi:MAG: secondary thiamine-phosphate synthase enzyme YjbQ [Thermodesulfobacteriota bacterium]
MAVETKIIELSTNGDCDVVDITRGVESAVRESSISSGTITVFVPGSTAGVTTIEYESGAISDLKEVFSKLVPENEFYAHNARWGDGNGHSHIRASILGPSLSIPFQSSALITGTWQQVIVVDFDNRPRNREIILQIIGE